MAERYERKHHFTGNSSFCQVHAFEVWTPTSMYRQFIICMFYLSIFHTKQDFVFKYITSCNFIYNASGIFNLWEFYRSHCQFFYWARVHVLLPGTQWNVMLKCSKCDHWGPWGGGGELNRDPQIFCQYFKRLPANTSPIHFQSIPSLHGTLVKEEEKKGGLKTY